MSAVDAVFFASGTPEGPGEALDHYKRRLRALPAGDWPRWHVDPGNHGLLSRAVGELAAAGAPGLEIVLAAVDHADDDTEVLDEDAHVRVIRRIRRKGPGLPLRLALSVGRPYVLPPPSLDVSTHDLCGLRCGMCGNRASRADPERMTPEQIGAILRESAAWGIERVALTGAGEPFRDPHMLDHLAQTQAQGQLATVTTNGLVVTEALAERLAGMHASISVSIHGASDAVHEGITGVRGSGAGAWRGVERLVAARERLGARGRLSVNVSTVIQRANVHEVLALVRRSRDAGCDGHNTQPVNHQHGRFDGDRVVRRDDAALYAHSWPTPEQGPALDALFDDLVAFRRAHGHLRTPEDRLRLFRRYFADSSREALGVACRVGESFLGVDHRGRIKPCYRLPWQLGDARLRSLRRLWNSRAYARVRARVDACPLTCMNNCFFRT